MNSDIQAAISSAALDRGLQAAIASAPAAGISDRSIHQALQRAGQVSGIESIDPQARADDAKFYEGLPMHTDKTDPANHTKDIEAQNALLETLRRNAVAANQQRSDEKQKSEAMKQQREAMKKQQSEAMMQQSDVEKKSEATKQRGEQPVISANQTELPASQTERGVEPSGSAQGLAPATATLFTGFFTDICSWHTLPCPADVKSRLAYITCRNGRFPFLLIALLIIVLVMATLKRMFK